MDRNKRDKSLIPDLSLLEQQTSFMITIAPHYFSQEEIDSILLSHTDECFAIYFIGRILGNEKQNLIVINPMESLRSNKSLLKTLASRVLAKESQNLIEEQPEATEKLFNLGIHVSNVEKGQVISDFLNIQ